MGWRSEVQVMSTGQWDTNLDMIFATEDEAAAYAAQVAATHAGTISSRAVEVVGAEPTRKFENGAVTPVYGGSSEGPKSQKQGETELEPGAEGTSST